MKRLTVLGLLATAMVGASGVTPVAVGASTNAASISWSTCDDPGLQDAGAQCALLPVPLDYARPDGAKIKIAVSRIKHTVPDAQGQGVMLINAGGPGVPGIANELSTWGQLVPNGAGVFSSRRRHTRFDCDWSSDVCSSDLAPSSRTGGRTAGSCRSS